LKGLRETFMRSVSALGSDVLYIEKMPWEQGQHMVEVSHPTRFHRAGWETHCGRVHGMLLAVSVEAFGQFAGEVRGTLIAGRLDLRQQ
jgi:hypothetical protein